MKKQISLGIHCRKSDFVAMARKIWMDPQNGGRILNKISSRISSQPILPVQLIPSGTFLQAKAMASGGGKAELEIQQNTSAAGLIAPPGRRAFIGHARGDWICKHDIRW